MNFALAESRTRVAIDCYLNSRAAFNASSSWLYTYFFTAYLIWCSNVWSHFAAQDRLTNDFNTEAARILAHIEVPAKILDELHRYRIDSVNPHLSVALYAHSTKNVDLAERQRLLGLCRASPLVALTFSGLEYNI